MTTEESRAADAAMCPHGAEFAPVGAAWGTKYRNEAGKRAPLVCECCCIPVRAGERRCSSCPVEEAS